MRLLIDFTACQEMLGKLRENGAEIVAQSNALAAAADPAGIFEGEGGDAYLQYLEEFKARQAKVEESIDALAGIIERFTGAVEEGNTNVAVSILNSG